MFTIIKRKDTSLEAYHGTSLTRAWSILRQGFLAKETRGNEIYFTPDKRIAISYAKSRAEEERDDPVIIKCGIDLSVYDKYEKYDNIYSFQHSEISSGVIQKIHTIKGYKENLEIFSKGKVNQAAGIKRKGGMYVNKKRLLKDLEIVRELKRQGVIADYDYNVDGKDNWIIIYGIPLPKDKFNYPDFNMKLPIPENLYEPDGKGRYQFYSTIFIDAKLRRKSENGYEHIARQIPRYDREQRNGWSYLCVIPRGIGAEKDIRAVIPLVQRWIITDGESVRKWGDVGDN